MPKALFWSLISGGICLMLGIGIAVAWVQRRTNPTRQMVLSPTPTTTPTANLPTGTGGAVPGVSTRSPTPPPITQAGSALVIDPPSNVRESPNGQIICAVREKININLYERQGLWYKTDVCGRMGWIHTSQLKF